MSIFGNQYDAAYLLSDYPDDLPEDFEKNPCKRTEKSGGVQTDK